ncbi:MAG: TolC family protein [Hyphomicrobiaceae bacterium]|nr:TolC family protein [Hyphomicrobiaceae bacterium]
MSSFSRAVLFSTVSSLALAACTVAPKPLTKLEIASNARSHLRQVTAKQEPVTGPISLYEAMARALKYNLDHRVGAMDAALRIKELDLAHFSMLPNAVASSGYAARDRYSASRSQNILTGQESLAFSTSQEKRILTADVSFSWNVLDFGLSYVRAKQAADKYLIADEMRRKVVHRVIEDVRTAYWRAVSADRLIVRLQRLEKRVRRAQVRSRAISSERRTSPITAVTYERELVQIKRTIQELQRDLSVAKTQLSALMNLKPGTPYRLAPGAKSGRLRLVLPVKEMVWTAMNHRSELREVWYRRRINDWEVEAALLELLPGLTPYAGTNFDSNDFLYNSHWLSWGAKASWNLIKVFQYPVKRDVIKAQDKLYRQRALAVTMAVITQVHVSRVRFFHHRREYQTAREYLNVQRRLVSLMRKESRAGRISEQTLIREELNTLVAEAKRDISYAALQNAFANVYASMGLDPYPHMKPATLDVQTLARDLRSVWVERGDMAAGRWAPRLARR